MRASTGAAVVLLLLGLAGPVRAAAIGIEPILLELSPEATTTLLTLRNDGSEPVRLQLSAFTWAQDGKGKMQLSPTSELVVFPPLLEVAAGEKRNIRVGTTAAFGAAEKSFRILVDELPPLRRAGEKAGIVTLTHFSMPVFLAPLKAVESLKIEGLAIAGGVLRFRLRNAGTVRARPGKINVEAVGRGEKVFTHEWSGWYVLAGGESEYEVEVPKAACARAASFAVQTSVDTAAAMRASIESAGAGCAQ